ncbi:MAG: hypothetical protein FWH04_07775 [Oscillospiraceae bacterium]|nr:hypothetical protein [Oscillospiraceae bacterium]
MGNVYFEHMIRRKMGVQGVFLRVLIIIGAVILLLIPFAIGILQLLPVVAVAAIFGAKNLFSRFDYEFEYIITNSEMDVDRIMGKKSRKRLLTVDCRSFEILAPYRIEHIVKYEQENIVRRIDASSSPDSPDRYFALFPDKSGGKPGGMVMLVFEPNERMMDAFHTYAAKKIMKR